MGISYYASGAITLHPSPSCYLWNVPNLFDSPRMAEGYARSRPAVHPHVVRLVAQHLSLTRPLPAALDIGCGAGLSTAPLLPLAGTVAGIEPAFAMLQWARQTIPQAHFASASAEALPFPASAFDLITAAGSLNWSDLSLVLPEIRRALKHSGTFVLYDFGQGRDVAGSSRLGMWDDEFKRRYPSPPALTIAPGDLDSGRHGLRLLRDEGFAIPLPLEATFYLEYALTETNVAEAIRNGAEEREIRSWCAETLRDVFRERPLDVVFKGFAAYYQRAD